MWAESVSPRIPFGFLHGYICPCHLQALSRHSGEAGEGGTLSDKYEDLSAISAAADKHIAKINIDNALATLEKYSDLTPDHKRFIDAMIRGVFDCGHCANRPEMVCVRDGEDDSFGVFEEEWPCEDWQERKEGEDGEV